MDQDHGSAPSKTRVLSPEHLQALLRFDTCTLANAIECFGVRLRNEGFTRPGLTCVTGQDERILGYASTFRVRTSGNRGRVRRPHRLVERNGRLAASCDSSV